jgi:hypothetical protein
MVISLVHTSLGLSYLIAHVLHYLSSSPHAHSFVYGTAALDDLDTPADDIEFLRGVYETERQADFDRANPVAYAARTGTPYHDLDDED